MVETMPSEALGVVRGRHAPRVKKIFNFRNLAVSPVAIRRSPVALGGEPKGFGP